MALHTTQRTNTTHLSEKACAAVGSMQYLLEKRCPDAPNPPVISHDNQLQVFVCGEEGFAQIAKDIKQAKTTIDLICWGFDPAMNLVRSPDGRWKEENSFGHLLEKATQAKPKVKVRLLVWYNPLGSRKQSNMPGYAAWGPNLTMDESVAMSGAPWVVGTMKTNDAMARHDFCVQWYRRLIAGDIKGLTLHTRDGQAAAISRNLSSEAHAPEKKGLDSEARLLERFGTHHQKTILIDYKAPNQGIGYVMGLNSVTDYWDSTQHLIDDPRRESTTDPDERAAGFRYKKPYQDYACRIEGGGALQAVHANFEAAWARASGQGDPSANARIAPVGQVHMQPDSSPKIPSQPAPTSRSQCSSVQVLRTQPEDQEKSIKAFYLHSSEVARDYLYIENQYFFYPEWAEHLKQARKSWVKKWQANCAKTPHGRTKDVLPEDMPKLHVMVVIPEPEIEQMVPRTYETLRHLGQEGSMRAPKFDAKGRPVMDAKTGKQEEVGQDVLMERAQDIDKQYQSDVQAFRQRVQKGQRPGLYPAQPYHSPVVQTARAIAPLSASALEAEYGLKVSTAMLYTCGLVKVDKPAKGAPAQKMAYRGIYIHSKLLMHSDGCFTLGSANLNQRSMAADSEINIASDCPHTTKALRKRIFELHSKEKISGGTGQKAAIETFQNWVDLMNENKEAKDARKPMTGFLLPFQEGRECEKRYG